MHTFLIRGGVPLQGDLRCPGAKNSALPVLAASLLPVGKTVIRGAPAITDTESAVRILTHLGAVCERQGRELTVDAGGDVTGVIPEDLMREMRSSFIFLGALLARTGFAEISLPGGCEIGQRPIDLHLYAMKRLGAVVTQEAGRIRCEAPNGLTGAKIHLSFPSVGATENAMIAAALAKGETAIENAAREPEISDLADCLNAMGADVRGAGGSSIRIRGVKAMHPCVHRIIPDRIVAATFLIAGAITGGSVRVTDVIPGHLGPIPDLLEQTGCRVETSPDAVALTAAKRPVSVGTVRTMPYPGFPTDAQAPFTAYLGLCRGTGVVIETIFESRYKYVAELSRFGARIRTDSRMAVIEGVDAYVPANALAPDLRGGAALVLAALAAPGESRIEGARHIDRGYEPLEQSLGSLGADIRRI